MHIVWPHFIVDESKNSTLSNENMANSTSQRGGGDQLFSVILNKNGDYVWHGIETINSV